MNKIPDDTQTSESSLVLSRDASDPPFSIFFKAFCNGEKPQHFADHRILYWTPLGYLVLSILLFFIDGLIPRLCTCFCARTPTATPCESQPPDAQNEKGVNDLHLDPHYEAKMVHNPEMMLMNAPSPTVNTTERPPPSSSVAPSTESVSRVASAPVTLQPKENAGRSVKQAVTPNQQTH